MDEVVMKSSFEHHLDIFGEQPGLLKLYTQISFFYRTTDTTSRATVVDTLNAGLGRLSTHFPWVAGQVVYRDGTFKMASYREIPHLSIKDFRHDISIASFHALAEANFPIGRLSESWIAPIPTLAAIPGSTDFQEAPILLLQASFIKGGYILTIVGQHNVMDMVGQGQLIHLLDKACRNEPFTTEEILVGNQPREGLVTSLDDSWQPGPEMAYQMVVPTALPSTPTPLAPPPACSWVNISFTAESLSAIKSLASEHLPSSVSFISTDDALSAFIWRAVTRARLLRLPPNTSSILARAVDVRRFVDLPATYMGMLQNMTYHKFVAEELSEEAESLSVASSSLRQAINPAKLGQSTRAIATWLRRADDKSGFNVVAGVNPGTGLMLSSWVKIDCYAFDFGLGLGYPESVRRPGFTPVEGLVYLLPKARDESITVTLSLRDDDLVRLKEDETIREFATWDG